MRHRFHGDASRSARLGYVAQDETFPSGRTARQVVLAALTGELIEDHERATRVAVALSQAGFSDPDVGADLLSGG